MTDRELLEFAANAAGLDLDQNRRDFPLIFVGGEHRDWNPLTDDGDALRLAVRVGMLFAYAGDGFETFQRLYREELDANKRPSEATRRAIVRTAAAMAVGAA